MNPSRIEVEELLTVMHINMNIKTSWIMCMNGCRKSDLSLRNLIHLSIHKSKMIIPVDNADDRDHQYKSSSNNNNARRLGY
jgi:hypothetical protein